MTMPGPYYADEFVTLYHGDCLEVLPRLDVRADVLLTDPPYFKVKDDEWDNQWDKAHKFLEWLGHFLDVAKPLLEPHASVWVFASPVMASSVERLIGERFCVLNSIRWVKEQGWHQRAEIEALRSYLTPWEGVIFAEQYADAYPEGARAIGRSTFAPFGRYLRQERERAGWSCSDLELALGFTYRSNPLKGTKICYRWEEGSSIPTTDAYERMRSALGPAYLQRDYDELRREFEQLRRPFRIPAKANSTDIWDFPTVAPYPGRHPCQKPSSMLRHMIEVGSKRGQLILDPFVGSGSTLQVAKDEGRRAVGIEASEHWCEHAARRLAQGVLNIGEAGGSDDIRELVERGSLGSAEAKAARATVSDEEVRRVLARAKELENEEGTR